MASSLVGCQALPCAGAAGCCLAEPGREAAGCRTLGDPVASAGSLVGGVRVQKTLGLLPTCWQVKPDPGVSAGLLAGRAGSWNLAAGPRDPGARFRSLVCCVGRRGDTPSQRSSHSSPARSAKAWHSPFFFFSRDTCIRLTGTCFLKEAPSVSSHSLVFFSLLISHDLHCTLVGNLLFPHQLFQCTWTQ